MARSISVLYWGNPDSITTFNLGDPERYRELLWGNSIAITAFNLGDNPDHYRDLLWNNRGGATDD
jgi:hypothetical protein